MSYFPGDVAGGAPGKMTSGIEGSGPAEKGDWDWLCIVESCFGGSGLLLLDAMGMAMNSVVTWIGVWCFDKEIGSMCGWGYI